MQNKGRSYRKKAHSSEDEEEGCNPENSEAKEQIRDSQDASETLEELIELRKYRRRPQGIDVEKLSKGDIKLRKKKKEEDPWKLNSGGLVDIEAVKATKDEEDDESSERKIMLDSFTKQTNALDVDKHMMAFIEEEMRKRRGQTAVSQNDEEDTDIKPPNPEDELFQPPDHLRIESKPISEGNVQLSTTMLTAIPEVDLGIDVRLKNIEDTEKAKRQLLEQRHQKPVEDKTSFAGSSFSATNRFYRSRPTTSDQDRGQTDHSNKPSQHQQHQHQHQQPNHHHHHHHNKGGQRREMATDDIARILTAMDQAVYETLSQVLSSDPNVRISAELRLKDLEKLSEYPLSLSKMMLANDFVSNHWSPKAEKFFEPEPNEKTKSIIREFVYNGLSDPFTKIRVISASIVSKIAHNDWPEAWPNLVDLLMSLLKTGSPNHVHGAMRVLTEFVTQDVTDQQFAHIAPLMLPELLKIVESNGVYSYRTRGRAVAIFRHSLEILFMLKEEHPEATDSFIAPISAHWLQLFVNILNQRATNNEELEYEAYSLNLEIIKCSNLLIQQFPKLISLYVVPLLEAIWMDLVNQHSDGETVGFEYLLYAQFEFVGLSIRKKSARNIFIGNNGEGALLKEIIWIIISYMQMTEDQVETWLTDANQFVADDDDETYNFNVRVTAEDLLEVLLDKFSEQAFQALAEATNKHFEESNHARAIGDPTWWKVQEACLKAIGSISSDLIAAVQEQDNKFNFDLAGLFNNVVLNHLSASDLPFLQGRAFVFSSQFASILPANHAFQYVSAAVVAVQSNGAIPVQISGLRALKNFCRYLEQKYLVPHQAKILEGVANLLRSSTEDTLILVLETLEAAIKIDKDVTAQYEHIISPLVIEVWVNHSTDQLITAVVTDLFEILASNSSMYATFQARALPPLANAIGDPTNTDLTASAIDLIRCLVKGGPTPLPEGYVQHIFPSLMHLLLMTEDRDILQSGQDCLKFFVQKDCAQLARWNDGSGKTGLDYIIQFIGKLLQPSESESAALFLGDLIVKLIHKAGDAIVTVLPELLRAVTARLETAKTPTFIQSMVIIFAHLIIIQLETVVNFLSNLEFNERNGLELLLSTWFENYESFQGYYSLKVSAIALSKLFLSADPRIQNIQVKGDLIITPNSTRIMTRSRTRQNPEQYTSIPATVKIIKLLISDLQNAIESDITKKPDLDDEDEDEEAGDTEEEDGEWEDVDDPSPFAPAEDYVILTKYLEKNADLDDVENDPDIKDDPVFQTNLKEYLNEFFRHCAAQNINNFLQICDESLNHQDKLKLEVIIMAK
ncbi:hypothetical protein G9A89_006173 [Geosiphon pyriformis]|nr:hypothetical protein G9A89_006173 [Geosiphon pyriformis]